MRSAGTAMRSMAFCLHHHRPSSFSSTTPVPEKGDGPPLFDMKSHNHVYIFTGMKRLIALTIINRRLGHQQTNKQKPIHMRILCTSSYVCMCVCRHAYAYKNKAAQTCALTNACLCNLCKPCECGLYRATVGPQMV